MIEYSKGLDPQVEISALCSAAHEAIIKSKIFPVAGIRVRAHCCDHYIVADGDSKNNFAALTFSVGSGRSEEALKTAGDMIFKAVQAVLSEYLAMPYFALSLEIRIINPALSWKDTPIHSRLSSQNLRKYP